MFIRSANISDIRQVLALWTEADAQPTVTDDDASLQVLLRNAPNSLLVAEDSDKVLGSLIVGWDGWRGTFYRLAVASDYRRRGIARSLVFDGERQLIRLGARRIAVFAVNSDEGAVPFWEALGYVGQTDRQRLVKNIASP